MVTGTDQKSSTISVLGLVVVVLMIAVGISASRDAVSAASRDHRIIVGMATTKAYHSGWHDNESGVYSALDLTNGTGPTGGANVYHQEYGISGYIAARTFDHRRLHDGQGPSICTGVDVELYDRSSGAYLGQEHYVHVNPAQGSIGIWFYPGLGWTFLYLGSVSNSQPAGCPWYGAHLHQSGHNDWYTAIWTNWSIANPISPTGSYWSNWMHKVL